MSIQPGQMIDRDTLNKAYVSKSATGTQIMAGSLRLLGGITIDGTTTLGALTVGAISAGSSAITTTGTITAGTFSGSGASLTNLPAGNLTGTVADARLTSNVMLLGTAQTITTNKTFSNAANLYFAGGTTYKVDTAGNAKFLGLAVDGNLTMLGDKLLEFTQVGVAGPSDSSAGTKIKLYNDNKYSIGIETASIWYDAYTYHRFYTNSGGTGRTERFQVNTTGATVYGSVGITQDLEVQGEIKVGIDNEFPDPLLAGGTIGKWTPAVNGAVAFDIQTPTGTGALGSIKLTASAGDNYVYYDYKFDVNPNEWITYSAYLFATTTNKASQLYITWLDASSAIISHSSTDISNTPTSWTRYKLTAQAPSNARYFKVRIDNDGGAGAIMYFSAFQVGRGRAMTGFKPYGGGKLASFFDKGIKLGSDGEIHSGYNNDFILKDHGNGNVTLSAANAHLYLGYQNTSLVRLHANLMGSDGSTKIADTVGKLYYQGADIDNRYLSLANGGTLSGDLSITKNNAWLTLDSPSSGADGVEQAAGISIGESGNKGSAAIHVTYTGDGYGHIGMGSVSGTTSLPQYEAMRLYYQDNVVRFYAAPTVNGSTVWHAGNDGAGSGLDADVLDGMQPATANTASTIVQRDGSGNFSAGTITASLNGTATNISNTGTVTLATATESNAITITQPTYSTDKPVKLLNFNWYSDTWSVGNIRSGSTPSSGLGVFLNSVEKFRFVDGNFKVGTNNVWHAGNVGAGSGLNADQVDGKHSSDLMSSTVYREKVTIPVGGYAALSTITIPNSRVYVTGSNRLQVFRDGILQELTDDYIEATTSTIKFQYALPEDTRITFIINNAG